EVVAQLLHALSRRSDQRFFPVSVAALPESLFESELFGHARGAFTGAAQDRAGCFEEAGTGTLFLDEIGDVALEQQTKLLRVLQSRQYSRVGESTVRESQARMITATNRDLAKVVEEGRF